MDDKDNLNYLARLLAESRMKQAIPPDLHNKLTGPIYTQAQNSIFTIDSIPATPLAPVRDLVSPLTKKWSPIFYRIMQQRLKVTVKRNPKVIKSITNGLTMPDIQSLTIGCAKKMEAAILFFDLENFTATTSKLANEDVLFCLNVIIPSMMKVTKHWNGEVEKNTGDGIMAIFGTETRNSFVIARDAIESAMAMKYLMIEDIQPKLIAANLPLMNFRIGIEMGDVLISRIGVDSLNYLTVVGDAANRASKLQGFANQNGICIGENVFKCLAPILHQHCEEGSHEDWRWQYQPTGAPYRFFHFNYNWPEPKEWLRIRPYFIRPI